MVVMFPSLPIRAGINKYPWLRQSPLTWESMPTAASPTEDKSQMLVGVKRSSVLHLGFQFSTTVVRFKRDSNVLTHVPSEHIFTCECVQITTTQDQMWFHILNVSLWNQVAGSQMQRPWCQWKSLPGCLIWVLWAPADKIEEQVIRRPSASCLTMLPQSQLSGHLTTDHMWASRTQVIRAVRMGPAPVAETISTL